MMQASLIDLEVDVPMSPSDHHWVYSHHHAQAPDFVACCRPDDNTTIADIRRDTGGVEAPYPNERTA